ncbi:MAG: dihydroorotate dehydrogenase electron transfer subunit [Acidobacteria bacterium]|nr:dihydroorotate dehydrogenase electron transfer subunit [Acidobacteriota bacterium]
MPGTIDTLATVECNDLIESVSTRSYGQLRLRLDRQIPVLPGQFAMIKPHGHYEPLLRRAMAYYRCGLGKKSLSVDFIYQILGRGTQMLAKLKAGDEVDFLGSLGNTFYIEAAHRHEALLVAGGVGSAALFMLAEELVRCKIPTKLFIGGAGRGDLCGLGDFISLLSSDQVISATMDGSYGEKGFVTVPFEKHLQSRRGEPMIIYACGPDPMLHRVSQIADQFAVPAQLSLESPMACGFGICVGCAVAVKAESPVGFIYKKVCTDGPVFWSNELHW